MRDEEEKGCETQRRGSVAQFNLPCEASLSRMHMWIHRQRRLAWRIIPGIKHCGSRVPVPTGQRGRASTVASVQTAEDISYARLRQKLACRPCHVATHAARMMGDWMLAWDLKLSPATHGCRYRGIHLPMLLTIIDRSPQASCEIFCLRYVFPKVASYLEYLLSWSAITSFSKVKPEAQTADAV